MGVPGGEGEGGTCGSGRTTCSPVQRLSKPAASAAIATFAATAGSAQAPMLVANSPIFMARLVEADCGVVGGAVVDQADGVNVRPRRALT